MTRARVNGEGSIFQRKSDGRWIGTVTVGWRDGKQLRKVVSAKTAQEARVKLDVLRATVGTGIVTSNKVTVDVLLDRWFDDVLSGQVAPNTADNYRTIANRHLRPMLGKRPVAKLTTTEIDRLLAAKCGRGSLSPRCAVSALCSLRRSRKPNGGRWSGATSLPSARRRRLAARRAVRSRSQTQIAFSPCSKGIDSKRCT